MYEELANIITAFAGTKYAVNHLNEKLFYIKDNIMIGVSYWKTKKILYPDACR